MSAYAVIYLRVSTDDQAESGLSIAAQEATCRAFADRNGWPISAVCRDEGVSGSKPLKRRPALKEAIATLGDGGLLVVARRDRLLRCNDYDRAVILRAIESKGARLKSTAGEGTEDDSPECWLMAWILDGMAYFERAKGVGRTKAALAHKRTKGEQCGQLPYGFRLAADGRTAEPDPEGLALVQAIRGLRGEGLSLRAIGARLAALGFATKDGGATFAPSTIRRLLQRESDPCPKT